MKRYFRGAVCAVALAFVVVGLPVLPGLVSQASAEGADEPANGKLLDFGESGKAALRDLAGGSQELSFWIEDAARFSPDGSMIATPDWVCSGSCSFGVRIYSASGSVQNLPLGFEEEIQDITWSPDQTRLAVSVPATEDAWDSYDIWVVPLNGSPARRVVASTPAFQVFSGIAWRPTSDEIAIVATPKDVVTWGGNSQQLYLVSASGGSPTLFNSPLLCDDWDCREFSYREPAWSPDGSKLAAYVWIENSGEGEGEWFVEEYLGLVSQGQTEATKVKEFKHIENPDDLDDWDHLAARWPVWSANGKDILFAQQKDSILTSATVLTLQGGAETPLEKPSYLDWQPCPTGTCVRWGAPDTADLKLTVTGYDKKTRVGNRDKITATVTNLGPDPARDVSVKVATPKGMFYTEVTAGPWTCDLSKKTAVVCKVAELASGAKASVKIGLLALDVRDKAQLVVSASTKSYDPKATNNTVRLSKKLQQPLAPKRQTGKVKNTSGKLVSSRKPSCTVWTYVPTGEVYDQDWCTWVQHTKASLQLTATKLTCAHSGGVNNLGYTSGVLWIWEGGKSGANRLKLQANREIRGDYGIIKHDARKTSYQGSLFSNDKVPHKAWMSFVWARDSKFAQDRVYVVKGKWTWAKQAWRDVNYSKTIMECSGNSLGG